MVENDHPRLFEVDDGDSNAEVARRIGEVAARMGNPMPEVRKSEAAIDQSGIPEDLEVNPIPIELSFLSQEEWHLAQISNPSWLLKQKPGAIKRIAGVVTQRLLQANEDFTQAFERNPDSEDAKKADKRLKFWNEHHNDLMSYSRIETAVYGDRQ